MPSPSEENPFIVPPKAVLDQAIADSISIDPVNAICLKDLESRFVRINDYMAERLGVKNPETVLGKTDFDLFDYDYAQDARNDELDIIATGEAKLEKLMREVRLGESRVCWVLTSKMPWKNEAGEIIGTFSISRDITAQRDAESALEDSNKRLIEASRQAGIAEVVINVLHNIGNVFNSLNISSGTSLSLVKSIKAQGLSKVADLLDKHATDADFLQKDERGKQLSLYLRKLGDQVAKSQQNALKELNTLDAYVQHIKGILRTQQNHAKSHRVIENFMLSDVLEDAIQLNSEALTRHSIELRSDIEYNPKMRSDKHRILQILVNFIRNAKYACDENPAGEKCIHLSARCIGEEEVEISVKDTGIGIPPENLKSIFNHGFTTRPDGNGFGLHSCTNLATEIGGQISVESDGTGHGAKFTLRLPIEQKPESSGLLA